MSAARPQAAAFAALAATALGLALVPAPARAEHADRDKEANVTADHATLDDLHQVNILTGHVLLTKGTMRLTGERMEQRQDERGYQYYVAIAAPGELATFHERRDPVTPGVESTVDGVGERIEYDDKTDRVILIRRALVKKFDNGEQREVVSGERIVYDGRKDSYEVEGRGSDGTGSRTTLIIPPRSSLPLPAAPGAPPAPAPPSTGLQTDRQPPEAKP